MHNPKLKSLYGYIRSRYPELSLDAGIVELRSLLHVFILRTGYSCNFKCVHCFVEDKRATANDLSTQEIMQILSKLEDPNTLVALTGGEPTMRDDLVDILKYCKSRMFVTNIQTNAFKFADIEYVKALEPYLDTVFIPIHSHDMTIFDTTTAVPGSGQKIMQAIDNLINSKIILTTNTVINQHNYKTLEKTLDMIQELNPGEVMVLTALHPVGAARTTKVTPRLSDMKPYLATLARKYGYLLHTHYLPRCMFAPFHTLVANIVDDSDQNSKPGVDYIQGTWNKDMNYGKMEGTNKLKAESCRSCIFDNECIGVWREYGELYPDFAEELKPILR